MVKAAAVKASLFSDRVSDLVAGISPAESTTFLPSGLPSLPVASSQFSAAASASQGLFDVLGSKQEMHLHQLRLASALHSILSAPLVDAAFGTDGLVSPDDALAAFA